MAYLGNWFILSPVQKTNLVTNPSFELGTTGYSAKDGSSLARVTTYQKRGLYSLGVTPSAGTVDGVYYTLSLSEETTYTFSVDVKGVDGISYTIDMYNPDGDGILGSLSFTSDGEWARYAVTATTGTNPAIRLRVYKNNSANTGTFYVDGFQLEEGDNTTYIDGDEEGCTWLAGAHQSASARSGQYRGGGRWLSLLEDCNFAIEQQYGTGMAPLRIITQARGQGGGGIYSDTITQERQFSIAGKIQGDSETPRGIRSLHASRKKLINLTKPDLVTPKQPYRLIYTGAGGAVTIEAHYERGLDLNETAGAALEAAALASRADKPLWKRTERTFTASDVAAGIGTGDSTSDGRAAWNGGGGGNQAAELTGQVDIEEANYAVYQDTSGEWHSLGEGFTLPTPSTPNSNVFDVAVGVDGRLYVAGFFTAIGGLSTAGVAVWDGAGWDDLGGGLSGVFAAGTSIAVDDDGLVYVGGVFTHAGGVLSNGIAVYNPSTNTWSSLGSGADTFSVDIVVIGPDGKIYVGGAFNTMNGVACNGIAVYDPDTGIWDDLDGGMGGGSLRVYSIAFRGNLLFAAGNFTSAGGVACNNIAYWNLDSPGTWTPLASGSNAYIEDIAISPDSSYLYAAGNFTALSGVSATRIGRWNFSSGAWEALGAGANAVVRNVRISPDGDTIYFGGNFTSIGGITTTGIGRYIISEATYSAMGSGLAGTTPFVKGMYLDPSGVLYVGGKFDSVGGVSGTAYLARWTGLDWRTIAVGVQAILQARDGSIYFGGGFSQADGVANTACIARWLPSTQTFTALSSGANGVVHAIVEAPNGDIIIGGSFTEVGGVADTRGIARWDIVTETWEALDTGVAGVVFALAFMANGHLLVGGIFANASGVASTQNLARWDGSEFIVVATNGTNGAVNSIAVAPDGTAYYGGAFTRCGGQTSANYIAKHIPAVTPISTLSTGLNAYANDLALLPDGRLVVIGNFTQAGGQACTYIALWNDSGFVPLGSGLNAPGKVVAVTEEGQIYAGGLFTEAGGIELPDKVAIFGNNAWKPLGINLPGTAAVEAILVSGAGEVYLGFDTEGTATGQGALAVDNAGTTEATPVIVVNGPGRLYHLTNHTTGEAIFFDLTLQDGESATLDLKDKTFVSTFKGDTIIENIIEGSDLAIWHLQPGDNSVSIFIDDPDATAFMLWEEQHWSVDGGAVDV